MRRLTMRRLSLPIVAAAALAGLSAGPSGPVAQAATAHPAAHVTELTSSAPVTVVAGGLNEPRGLVWGPQGHLLVSEAGTVPSFCDGTTLWTQNCFGMTGSITDISSGTPVRIRTGLASLLNGGEMIGPDSLVYTGGHLYTVETASPQFVTPDVPTDLSTMLKAQYGRVLDVTDADAKVLANPGDTDNQWAAANGYEPDANPYALASNPNGGFYLVDGGTNTLDSVDPSGNVHVLSHIPSTPAGSDAVPTCLDVASDGAVYVGELTGVGNDGTAANVYRYAPGNHTLKVWESGFSAINGCGFGANGDFYVTEYDTTGFLPSGDPDGVVIQINHHTGTRTTLGEGRLFAPAGFLAGPDGSVYVADHTVLWPSGTSGDSTAGKVVRIG